MDYNLSIPDIYNIEHSYKNILSKKIILESDKIYDLDDIFEDLDKEHFSGIYIKTEFTNIYLSTNTFQNVLIYNNFFILDLFNRCNNYYNIVAKRYDSEIEIYIIKKPTTNIQTFNYILYDSKNLQKINNSNDLYYNHNVLFRDSFYNMNLLTLQINIICKNDKFNDILKFQSNNMIFYYKSKNTKNINNKQYLHIFYLHKIENIEKNVLRLTYEYDVEPNMSNILRSTYEYDVEPNMSNILQINNLDNVITYINKLNEINSTICNFLFNTDIYDTYNIDFTNYIIKNNIDKLYFFTLSFS